jgi:hypothetical protein
MTDVIRALAVADEAGAREVRVVVLARNGGARAEYRGGGFEPYLEVYSRRRP